MHLDEQAVEQQTPWAQMPLPHSVPPAHTAPFGLRPHDPATQDAGGAQSASAVQLDLHPPVPHVKGEHELDIGFTHTPAPSQLEAGVKVDPPVGQLPSAQDVPCGYFWQAPAWHLPLVPQLILPWSTHDAAGSAIPVGTAVQVPIEPVSAQDSQAPAQADVQQTPWAQLADRHSELVEQKAPFSFNPQELLLQTLPDEQLASIEQEVKHLAPLQANGVQAIASGARQLPFASQTEPGV